MSRNPPSDVPAKQDQNAKSVYFSSSRRRGKDHAPLVFLALNNSLVDALSTKVIINKRPQLCGPEPLVLNRTCQMSRGTSRSPIRPLRSVVPLRDLERPNTSHGHRTATPTFLTVTKKEDRPPSQERVSPLRKRRVFTDVHKTEVSAIDLDREKTAIIEGMKKLGLEDRQRRFGRLIEAWVNV